MTREEEVDHALTLFRETGPKWTGLVAFIQIDPVCRFGTGDDRCNNPITVVVSLQHCDEVGYVMATCDHHASIFEEALGLWPTLS